MRGYALGILNDRSGDDSECFIRTDNVANKIDELYAAMTSQTVDDFLLPFTLLNQLIVEISD